MFTGGTYREKLEALTNLELIQEFIINKYLDRDKMVNELAQLEEERGEGNQELSPQEEAADEVDVQVAQEDRSNQGSSQKQDQDASLAGVDINALPEDLRRKLNLGSGSQGGNGGGSNSRTVDQQNPPSMGTGHRGQVTDPEHDKRLKKNEDEDLHEKRVEAGRKGGESRGGRVEDRGATH